MTQTTRALRANILHAPTLGKIEALPHGVLIVEDGVIAGVFPELPEAYRGIETQDYGDRLLIPALCDLHLHAPQYPMMGMGMDLELLEWLNTYTFPGEERFADPEYAEGIYAALARELVKKGTTRAAIFASVHLPATRILVEELERAGISAYVGKVNMDRNCTGGLMEQAERSLGDTRVFVEELLARGGSVRPILTPRFSPNCTDALMQGLGALADEYDLPIQSHLSENESEVQWVRSLYPGAAGYWESYARFSLFRPRTLMAHCVHSDERERAAIRDHGVWVVHCPDSNVNLMSGIAPVRRMLNEGLSVALGSDISGGSTLSMMQIATIAIRASKQRRIETKGEDAFLTFAEAFYLATSAGAQYFGEGPGFRAGDPLHALVLDDGALPDSGRLPLENRLERLFYAADDRTIAARYANGKKLEAV
ncbi:MAG: amidohydrolase family protein [Bacillota bacterium]